MATTTAMSNNISGSSSVGGIAWGGSLVGFTNPNNTLGYRTKRSRPNNDKDDDDAKDKLPSSIVVQLKNREGELLSTSSIDVPTTSSMDQMSQLVHQLKLQQTTADDDDDDENKRVPYTFYATIGNDEIEITTHTLAEFFLEHHELLSTEDTLVLTYQPLAVFRVRPVTRCTDTMPGHTEAILHVSFSANGKHLASGGGDTTVRFWDTNTNLPKHTCRGHKNHVLCTAWSASSNNTFASGDLNGVLILWDPSSGKMLGQPIKAHTKWITTISWEPLHRSDSPNVERLITSSKDSLVKIWNTRTRQCLATLSGHIDSVECAKWGGEGLIYTASRDRTIKVWATKDVNNDTSSTNDSSSNGLGKLVRTLKGHGHRVNSLALSTDYLCRTGPYEPGCSNSSATSKVNSLSSPEDMRKVALERYKKFMSAHNGGEEMMVSGSDDFTLFLWSPTNDKHPVKRLTGHQQAVNHLAFSPDGRYIASASFDKKIKLWCGRSGTYITTLTGHVGAVYQVAWSSDSRYIVSASKDSTAKLWTLSGTAAKETLPGHADEVYALDWSPNGSTVATGSKDRTIKIWKH